MYESPTIQLGIKYAGQLKFARKSIGMDKFKNNCMLDSRCKNTCEMHIPKLMTDVKNTIAKIIIGKSSPRRGKSNRL